MVGHMKILILEDMQVRWEGFQENLKGYDLRICHQAQRAINALMEEGPWDLLFLDHDLGEEADVDLCGSGYDVACWLEQHPEKLPHVVALHSMNYWGRQMMQQAVPSAIAAPGICFDKGRIQALVDLAEERASVTCNHCQLLKQRIEQLERELLDEKTVPVSAVCSVCGKQATIGHRSAQFWCSSECREKNDG